MAGVEGRYGLVQSHAVELLHALQGEEEFLFQLACLFGTTYSTAANFSCRSNFSPAPVSW